MCDYNTEHHICGTFHLPAVSTLERSLLSMKEEQQKMHREHEKGLK